MVLLRFQFRPDFANEIGLAPEAEDQRPPDAADQQELALGPRFSDSI